MRAFIFLQLLFLPILGFSSELYDSLGHLKRDPAYQITARQLKRWENVEPVLLQHIVKNFRYPEIAREAEIECQILLALTVDTGGNILSLRMANLSSPSASDTMQGSTKMFFKELRRALLIANFKNELSFRPHPGKYIQTYYLPFYASVDKNGPITQYARGWLHVAARSIEPLELDHIICKYPYNPPITCIVRQVQPVKHKKLFRRKRAKQETIFPHP